MQYSVVVSGFLVKLKMYIYSALVEGLNLLREKSLAIYFEDSQSRRNRSFNIIVSKLYVDKRSRVH